MKHIFIINPHAGEHSSYEPTVKALEKFKDEFDIQVYKTGFEKDATSFIKEYLASHPTEEIRFYSAGGDGTLNEVVNGVMGHSNASISVYPSGSGNDFVKSLPNPLSYLDFYKLLTAENRKIDVLSINDSLYSINVCNFGFDSMVAKVANKLKKQGKRNSYEKGIVKALFCGMKNKVTIEVDGEVVNPKGKMLLSTVANGAYYGGKFMCAPNYSIDDGLIEFFIIYPTNIFVFLKLIKKYEQGKHLTDKKFSKITKYLRAKEVKMHSDKPFDVSLDGEIITGTDFTVKILEKSINFGFTK